MKFFKEVVSYLIKNAFEGHTKFNVADDTAVGDPVRSISLDAVPSNENTIISLSWDGGEKLFEKILSEQESSHQFDLISTDLAEVAALTKQGNYDAAKDLMKKLGQKYAENTGDIIDTNTPKLHNTQASESFDGLWKQAKASIRNTFQTITFDSPEELMSYQEKMKGGQKIDQDTVLPLWDQEGKNKGKAKDTLAPSSLSYSDVEEEKERNHEDMQKHIDEKIKTELESALQEKAASVFGPDQIELVKVLKKNGRNWDEIKKILTKDFNFDKDSVNIFVDEQRESLDPTGIEVEPVKEEPAGKPGEEKAPLTPPEELVSPETHEKLLQDHEDKKKAPLTEDKELNFTPKDVMDIPEDEEIEQQSSLNNEIARADNDEIHKIADVGDRCKCGHAQSSHFRGSKHVNPSEKHLVPRECLNMDCECKKFKKEASLKIAAPSDLNPLQEPLTEQPTTPNQDTVNMNKKPLDHDAPQHGDRVFVTTDMNNEKSGFEANFINAFKGNRGEDLALVETDKGDQLEVEQNRVVKINEGASGVQDTEPVMEPIIEQQQPESDVQVTPKMDDFHTSSQEDLLAIKKEAEELLILVKEAEEGKDVCSKCGKEVGLIEMSKWVKDGLCSECRGVDKQAETEFTYNCKGCMDEFKSKDKIDGLPYCPQCSAIINKKEAVAEGSVMDTKCEDCGKPLGPEAFLSKWPVCGACTKKKHKKVTQSSDFEKGISQNKTSADPVEAPKTQFKDYKKTPNYVPKEQAVPATPEMGELLGKIEAFQSNLDTLETARKQLKAKLNEEIAKIDQTGGRAEMEAALQETIEKTAVILSAMDNKVVQWKDKLYTLQTEQIDYVPSLNLTDWLEKFKKRFEEAEKFIEDVKNGMLSQAKRIVEKTLIRWPNKKSSMDKEANILDELNHYNDELLAALRLLSQPL